MGKEIKTVAIIGASKNRRKYGNIILRDLLVKGYTVVPVHPAQEEVEGIPVCRNLRQLPETTDLLVFVVPAFVGIEMTKEAISLGFHKLWFQPGAESGEIMRLVEGSDGISGRFHDCIMLKTIHQGDLEL